MAAITIKEDKHMMYEFRCEECDIDFERDIPLKDYDTEKNKVACPVCGRKAPRKYSVFIDRPESDGRGFYGK